jgi:general secretion pathway protein C
MELFFKKYFWTIDLVVMALAAWLLASTVNAVIGYKLRLLPAPPEGGAPPPPPPRDDAIARAADRAAARDNCLFGCPSPTPAALPPGAGEDSPDIKEPETYAAGLCPTDRDGIKKLSLSSAPIKLLATVVANKPEWSSAAISHTGKEQTIEVLYTGSSSRVDDALIVEWVRRNLVVISREGQCERLDLETEENAPKAAVPPYATTFRTDDDAGEEETDKSGRIVKVDDTNYEIAQEEITDVLSNLSQVATQARIVPNFRNGKADGFKLFSIRPNSIYAKIGIRNGDIIKKINDYVIDSPDKALEVYQKLKDASNIKVELERRGQTTTMNYSIR